MARLIRVERTGLGDLVDAASSCAKPTTELRLSEIGSVIVTLLSKAFLEVGTESGSCPSATFETVDADTCFTDAVARTRTGCGVVVRLTATVAFGRSLRLDMRAGRVGATTFVVRALLTLTRSRRIQP